METDPSTFNRLIWHSYRGLRELDVLLLPFAKEALGDLSQAELADYERLISHEDQDLFRWFLGSSEPDDKELMTAIGKVLEHAKAKPGQGIPPIS